jgi:hypothetical protein
MNQEPLDVALDLARREEGAARSNVLKSGLASAQSDIRTKSLRLCRSQPEPALLNELLRAASGGGDERYLAIHALSALDDPRAQRCVLEAARDEGLPKVERARAIGLLARSKLPEAVEFLKQLASSKESEFASVALDALAAMQQNAPK